MPTPARPTIGVGFSAGGFGTVDNRFNGTRTMLTQLLIRDARGADTNISPHNQDGSVAWTPFATDGNLRGDLFAQLRTPAGAWVTNSSPNDGWFQWGAWEEGGSPSEKQSISTDDLKIDNQVATFDSMVTDLKEIWSVTPVEINRPIYQRVRNHLPLQNAAGVSLVELPGGKDVGWGRPLDIDNPDRQLLLIVSRKVNGLWLHTVKGASLCKIDTLGDVQPGKKGKRGELAWSILGGDGYFSAMQDGVYTPVATYTWYSGNAWTGLGTGGNAATPMKYTVSVGAATAGTFTLTYRGNTTAAIQFNANSTAVKAALVALDDGFVDKDWSVTGTTGPWTITTPGGPLTGTGTLTGGTLAVTPTA